jgi:hypothetical protein
MRIHFFQDIKSISQSISRLCAFLIATILIWSCAKDSPDASQKESFIKYFGGAYENIANDMVQLDGNFYIIGTVNTSENISFLRVIKADEYGNSVWTKDFKATYSVSGSDIIVLNDKSGIAILGTQANSTSSDFYFLKLNLDGDTLLTKTYNHNNDQTTGKSLAELENGGFLLTGTDETSDQSQLIITTNPDGTPLREPVNSGLSSDAIEKIVALSNNSNIVGVGKRITSESGSNGWPMLLIYDEQQGTTPPVIDFPAISGWFTDVLQISDNEILACGAVYNSTGNHSDGLLVSIDISNTDAPVIKWQKAYDSDFNSQINALTLTSDNSVMMTGWKITTSGDKDLWMVKTDLSGTLIDEKTFGYTNDEMGNAIIETDDGRFVTLGTFYYESNSMITLLKTSFE